MASFDALLFNMCCYVVLSNHVICNCGIWDSIPSLLDCGTVQLSVKVCLFLVVCIITLI